MADLFGKLRALGLSARDYDVFGSGPSRCMGLVREARDLGVVARGAACEEARNVYAAYTRRQLRL